MEVLSLLECDTFSKDKNHYRLTFVVVVLVFLANDFSAKTAVKSSFSISSINSRSIPTNTPQKTKVGEAILFL